MKIWIALFIVLALPLATAIDAPRWSVGDSWNYKGDMSYSVKMTDESINLSIDGEVTISINVEAKINDTVLRFFNNTPVVCYLVGVNSYINGGGLLSLKLPYEDKVYRIYVNLNMNVTANGETYITTKEIAVSESNLLTDVKIDIILDAPGVPDFVLAFFGLKNQTIRARNETKVSYTPPLDFLNFPINEGEEWWANCSAKYVSDGSEESVPVELKFKCPDAGRNTATILSDYIPFIGEITIDIMGYPVPIMNFENTTLLWNSDKGMIEKMVNRDVIDDEGFKISTNLVINLTNFNYNPRINKAGKASIICNNTSKVKESISFKADASDEDGIICYYWDFGDGTTSNKTNPTHAYNKAGKYTVKLTVIDKYGEETVATKTIEVKGEEKTPGFEILFLLIAFLIAIKKRF
ncbi:MAG: PKD domain-containing protein [Thermoplasmatales archaeon]|nr:PKD domain-containing protein [Thermoplasmatales archaeon]